jgi:16S rRNA (cytidine1402-2'-O)-methyltransferase
MPGILYVVGSSIGNYEDMTFRAVRILKQVDIIAAEDPLTTKRLLDHYDIHTQLTSYHPINRVEKTRILISRLLQGEHVAQLVDAGTPAVCDPGAYLVSKAIASGVAVRSIPGPCAAVAAFSICGIASDGFSFYGYLSKNSQTRRRQIATLKEETQDPAIIFEEGKRVSATLNQLQAILGNRRITLSSNITMPSELLLKGSISSVLKALSHRNIGDEVTIIIERSRKKV